MRKQTKTTGKKQAKTTRKKQVKIKRKKAAKKKSVNYSPVDIYVGKRLRDFRWLAEMTQSDLAKKVDVKFQQVQKYETGANRLSISRAFMICEALKISIIQLLGDYAQRRQTEFMKTLNSRQTLKLGRSFMRLKPKQREQVLNFIDMLEKG